MIRTIHCLLAAAALAGLLLASHARAAEPDANCVGFISGPEPTYIETPGTWCMRADQTFTHDHYAIVVMANDVTVDCQGFTLRYVGPLAVNHGVDVGWHSNVTIRNCTIKDFASGLYIEGADNLLVEHNTIDNAYSQVHGTAAVVRGNVFRQAGLQVTGEVDVIDNTFKGVNPRSGAGGIHTSTSASIRGNRISGGGGIVSNGGAPKIRDNELTGNGAGIGIQCTRGSTARTKDNLVTGYHNAVWGCRPAGGDYTSP